MTAPTVPFGWHELAACKHADLGLFFGPDRESEEARERRERRASHICAGCPVRPQCEEYAVGRPEMWGFWAGLNEDERRAERRRRLRVVSGCDARENERRRARRQAAAEDVA